MVKAVQEVAVAQVKAIYFVQTERERPAQAAAAVVKAVRAELVELEAVVPFAFTYLATAREESFKIVT